MGLNVYVLFVGVVLGLYGRYRPNALIDEKWRVEDASGPMFLGLRLPREVV